MHKPDPLSALLHPTGYFIHDSLDIIFNHQSRSSWEYLVHHAMVSTAPGRRGASTEGLPRTPGLSPCRFRALRWGKPEPFPPPHPGCQVGLHINKARVPGRAGRLPASAPSAGSQTGCRTG